MTDQSISREVARLAAHWLSVLHSGEASIEDRQACLAWRQASPEHEIAWSRVETLQKKMGLIPEPLGMETLGRKQRQDRRQAVKTLALLIAAGPIVYGTYHGVSWQAIGADYRTATGELRHITLADGTQLVLNTATAVSVNFDSQQRLLTLHEGEILLQTASDPRRRPLLVETTAGQLRPMGTRFIVRKFDSGQLSGMTRLGVIEGRVEVNPVDAPPRQLSAGQQADFEQNSIQAVESLAVEADAWSRGVLYAENMPLGQFVQELARYRRGILRCDPIAAKLTISGVFQLDNTDQILAALPDTLPVELSSVTGLWVTVNAR